jgi:hypothetical protein
MDRMMRGNTKPPRLLNIPVMCAIATVVAMYARGAAIIFAA